MPDLPEHVTADEIESHLDRVALEINATGHLSLIPIFEWLEKQLDARRRQVATFDRIRQRVSKNHANHTGALL